MGRGELDPTDLQKTDDRDMGRCDTSASTRSLYCPPQSAPGLVARQQSQATDSQRNTLSPDCSAEMMSAPVNGSGPGRCRGSPRSRELSCRRSSECSWLLCDPLVLRRLPIADGRNSPRGVRHWSAQTAAPLSPNVTVPRGKRFVLHQTMTDRSWGRSARPEGHPSLEQWRERRRSGFVWRNLDRCRTPFEGHVTNATVSSVMI